MDKRLRPHQHLAAVEPVNPDAGKGREEKCGNLPGKADRAQQQRRAGEAIDQPTGGDARHPGADERDALAAEEEAEVAMAQGAPQQERVVEGDLFQVVVAAACAAVAGLHVGHQQQGCYRS
jgi:hypothetical protein